jgi:hypothetical protein
MRKGHKYELGQHVLTLGKHGICIISGRGKMEFISGGKINMYQLMGANPNPACPEYEIITVDEAQRLYPNQFGKE